MLTIPIRVLKTIKHLYQESIRVELINEDQHVPSK